MNNLDHLLVQIFTNALCFTEYQMPDLVSLTSIVGHSVDDFLLNLGIIFPGFVFVIIVISCSISWLFLVK